MKPNPAVNVLLLLMSAGWLVALFQKPLGLPSWGEIAGSVFGGTCAVVALLVQRRAKKADVEPTSGRHSRQHNAPTVLILIVICATTLSSPFWLPYTGTRLSFSQLIVAAVVCCTFLTAVTLAAIRARRPKV